jgi:hypothetical protein
VNVVATAGTSQGTSVSTAELTLVIAT